MKFSHTIVIMLVVLSITACASTFNKEGNETGIRFVFSERFDDSAAFHQTVITITADYLWQSSSNQPEINRLYSKNDNVLYTLNHKEKSIKRFVATDQSVGMNIEAYTLTEELQEGATSAHHKHFVNGIECLNQVVEKNDELTHATAMIVGFSKLYAPNIAEKDLCNRVVFLLQPDLRYKAGFPVREWNKTGYTRFFDRVDHSSVIPDRFFQFPKGYEFISAD